MEVKRGIAVSAGVAIGPALVLDAEGVRIPQRCVEPARRDTEVRRLRAGLAAAAAEARGQQDAVSARLGAQYGAVFGAHALLIEDASLRREVEDLILAQGFTAEYAFSRVMRRYARTLEGLHKERFAARVADLFDIEKTVLRLLLGQRGRQVGQLDEPVIVLAHDLTPSQTASLDARHVHAFATEAGGRASHTAILAGALGIPALVGVGPFLGDVSGGDPVILDGNRGLLVLDPDEATLRQYEKEKQSRQSHEHRLEELRDVPARTRDGVAVALLANIEFPQEAAQCTLRGCDGVGLYRTEFLYLGRDSDPGEEEHYQAYLTVLKAVGPRPVVIRTLDLGADKFTGAEAVPAERNPFLGLRSLRYCLRNLTLFKTQLRAILRASASGDVRILFPMVSTLGELRQCRELLDEVKQELTRQGVAFNPRLAVGTMVEVPSAAVLADVLARAVDFFSIGTNDLIQYTLAADRTNEEVADLYSPGDPAVLRLIDSVVKAGRQHGVAVNVCGEMSGEPMYALLLVGMGLRQLSLPPHNVPEIKRVLRAVTAAQAEQIAREVLRRETAHDVNNYLREQANRLLPRYD